MLELLHVGFSFLCRSNRSNKSGKSPIVLRINFRNERRDLYTGLYCFTNEWNSNLGKVESRQHDAITTNKNLELINHKAHQTLDHLQYSREVFTIDDLTAAIKGKEDKPALFIEYFEMRNKEMYSKAGVDITFTTYEKYERSLRYVSEFLQLEYKAKNHPLIKMTRNF